MSSKSNRRTSRKLKQQNKGIRRPNIRDTKTITVSLSPEPKDWITTKPDGCYCERCRSIYLSFRFVDSMKVIAVDRCGVFQPNPFVQCTMKAGHREKLHDFNKPIDLMHNTSPAIIYWNGKRFHPKLFVDLCHAEKWASFCIPVRERHSEI